MAETELGQSETEFNAALVRKSACFSNPGQEHRRSGKVAPASIRTAGLRQAGWKLPLLTQRIDYSRNADFTKRSSPSFLAGFTFSTAHIKL
jgi:hypothetical protein